jgi:hypothetical protein
MTKRFPAAIIDGLWPAEQRKGTSAQLGSEVLVGQGAKATHFNPGIFKRREIAQSPLTESKQ